MSRMPVLLWCPHADLAEGELATPVSNRESSSSPGAEPPPHCGMNIEDLEAMTAASRRFPALRRELGRAMGAA